MKAPLARLLWGGVNLAAFAYVIASSAPGWAKALAIMLGIGFWEQGLRDGRE